MALGSDVFPRQIQRRLGTVQKKHFGAQPNTVAQQSGLWRNTGANAQNGAVGHAQQHRLKSGVAQQMQIGVPQIDASRVVGANLALSSLLGAGRARIGRENFHAVGRAKRTQHERRLSFVRQHIVRKRPGGWYKKMPLEQQPKQCPIGFVCCFVAIYGMRIVPPISNSCWQIFSPIQCRNEEKQWPSKRIENETRKNCAMN